MKTTPWIAASLGVSMLLLSGSDVQGIGRGGGAGRVGGGGGARPSLPARPSAPAARPSLPASRPSLPSRPASLPARPSTPAISPRPSPPQRPNLGGGLSPSINPPNRPTNRPAARPNLPNLPKVNPPTAGPGNRPDFNLPGNINRPSTLPKIDRPPVSIGRPDLGKKLPDIGKKLPDVGKKFPDIGKKLPDRIPDGKWADLAKKSPDLFPKDRPFPNRPNVSRPDLIGRPDLSRPDLGRPGRPTPGDLGNWLNPGAGAIVNRPDRERVTNALQSNITNAIRTGNINSGNFIRTGDRITNIDLSRNVNFQNLRTNSLHVNRNLGPYRTNWFNDRWFDRFPNRWPWWHYHRFPRPWSWWWRPVTWVGVTGWFTNVVFVSPPTFFDYGANFVVGPDVVTINNEPVASTAVYAQQAIQAAEVTPPEEDAKIEWLPLGTFALSSRKDDDDPSMLLQLALSREGLVSGSFYNRTSDKSDAVEGKVDPVTQRVFLRKVEQPDVVLEVGLYNLTREATGCLIHFGTMNTQQWFLTRLDAPEESKSP